MNGSQILKEALSTTVIGMGTVFSILVLMCLLISLFRLLPENRALKDTGDNTGSPDEGYGLVSAESVCEDEELAAVITAAVYEALRSESEDPDEYTVRSIREKADPYTARRIKR